MANQTNSLSRTKWAYKYHINEAAIKKYIKDQEKHDIALDKLSVKESEAPFKWRAIGLNICESQRLETLAGNKGL